MRNGHAAADGFDIKAMSAATYAATADHFDDPASRKASATRAAGRRQGVRRQSVLTAEGVRSHSGGVSVT